MTESKFERAEIEFYEAPYKFSIIQHKGTRWMSDDFKHWFAVEEDYRVTTDEEANFFQRVLYCATLEQKAIKYMTGQGEEQVKGQKPMRYSQDSQDALLRGKSLGTMKYGGNKPMVSQDVLDSQLPSYDSLMSGQMNVKT